MADLERLETRSDPSILITALPFCISTVHLSRLASIIYSCIRFRPLQCLLFVTYTAIHRLESNLYFLTRWSTPWRDRRSRPWAASAFQTHVSTATRECTYKVRPQRHKSAPTPMLIVRASTNHQGPLVKTTRTYEHSRISRHWNSSPVSATCHTNSSKTNPCDGFVS
jgi:hypothetical protein